MKKFRKQLSNILFQRTPKHKVNLFIVGEEKCGTSSLHSLLCESKYIVGGKRKELHYFDDFFEKFSEKEYLTWFHYDIRLKEPKYFLDSSPSYAHNDVLGRIAAYNPDAKIIYLTRNPIKRFISSYTFYLSRKVKNERNTEIKKYLDEHSEVTFDQFFQLEISDKPVFNALRNGNFPLMKSRLYKTFHENQVFIESLENMQGDPDAIKRLYVFLEIEYNETMVLPEQNVSRSKKLEVPESAISYLENYYKSV